MSETTFVKYRAVVRSESHLFEAASLEDLRDFLSETFTGEHCWVEPQHGKMRPFLHVAMKLGLPITPAPGR